MFIRTRRQEWTHQIPVQVYLWKTCSSSTLRLKWWCKMNWSRVYSSWMKISDDKNGLDFISASFFIVIYASLVIGRMLKMAHYICEICVEAKDIRFLKKVRLFSVALECLIIGSFVLFNQIPFEFTYQDNVKKSKIQQVSFSSFWCSVCETVDFYEVPKKIPFRLNDKSRVELLTICCRICE